MEAKNMHRCLLLLIMAVPMLLMAQPSAIPSMEGKTQTGGSLDGNPAQKITPGATFIRALAEWNIANPAPALDAGIEARAAFYKKRLQFLDGWLEKYPKDNSALALQLRTLSLIPDTPDDVLVRKGNQMLDAFSDSTDSRNVYNSYTVLKVWAQRGLELNRIPALVLEYKDKGYKNSLSSPPGASSATEIEVISLLYSKSSLRWQIDTNAWAVLVTAYAKNGQTDKAQFILNEWESALNAQRAKITEAAKKLSPMQQTAVNSTMTPINEMDLFPGIITRKISNDEAMYNEARAQVAAAKGQLLDALTLYQTSLRSGNRILKPASEDLIGDAERLWAKLGGSQAGWRIWLDSVQTKPLIQVQRGSQIPATPQADIIQTPFGPIVRRGESK
jgi:hypothetical protein